MSEKPDNPSAFACAGPSDGGHQEGMTLRDWFAGQALAGMLACPLPQHFKDLDATTEHDGYAFCAYKQADAMLSARNKEPQP